MNREQKKQAERLADLTFELLERCQLKRERMAEQLDLTVAEFKLLRGFQQDDVLSVSELARRVDLTSSRLTRIIDGLVEKGIVRREIGSSDRRVMNVTLTAKGREVRAELRRIFVQTHEEIIALLPPGVEKSVIFAMEKLRDALQQWSE
ncbi:MAG: MarR family transcriptional regulator [candidate division KSB1 bacterium]|nr:MarR family transcriptional regulator [candidate division KSB1 bacterium]MDZ7276505.1 MarR family transcriptional regulator [candidate division KSB1 bacterium]MDZ7286714.1 MarR family transcriptional regulator [candidate division KSB1 bacterium]MDZ7300275.1 MarR family transcriptional regulator [candidate division KSB1 bacterium]MDZ7351275.1 MarR family transcriptional regulator [candidate division KSB1 bacterium]